ncbi:hypothetical protein [Pseudogemmobacter humi]|uniref:hypothetical protein n=1 Tax=Pseudogemmobacter humi TaxID=2483812 RepID=UPI000F5327EC|nr:hypothetical protein [Pseudogemmobacter humi]
MTWEAFLIDPVATYAAALSTVTALAGAAAVLYKWLTTGPKAWVGVLNPKEVAALDYRTIEIIISNAGAEPFVVREVAVSFHKDRGSTPYHVSRFNHRSWWNPAMETIPNPNGKPNNVIRVAKVLKPREETHHHMKPSASYEPSTDWICVEVFLRHKRSSTKAWAAPILEAVNPNEYALED